MANQLCIPSLGRPFTLGMLYDCRTERCIPGRTLWDSKILDSAMKRSATPSSDYEIIAEDTITTKAHTLDINASLKLSLLGGMVELDGSARYLNDERSSEQQSRVTLRYKSTTRFEQLTMEQLGAIQHPQVLDDQDATHVVTGIKYGSDAFFVFDRLASENEKVHNVKGELKAAIKFIPISGSASVDFKETNKANNDKIQCKFYGDVILQSNPSTFEEAIKVYQELPKLFGGDTDKSVPKLIYLSPLSRLDGKANKIFRLISSDLVSKVEVVMKSFHTIFMRANDLLLQDICIKFESIQSQITDFILYVNRFKMNFVKELSSILPTIRGGGAEEKELAELISSVERSPFNSKETIKYLHGKSKEINILAQQLKNMSKEPIIKFAFPDTDCELSSLTVDDEFEHVVCFAFNVTTEAPAYIKNLKDYLETGSSTPTVADGNEWFNQPDLVKSLYTKSKSFLNFAKANSNSKTTAFVVTSCNEEIDSSGPVIALYTIGICNDFEPPGNPGIPVVQSITAEAVELSWKKPNFGAGAVTSYKILYHPTSESKECEAVSKDSCTQIKGLMPETDYQLQVQAMSDPGVSVKSEVVSFSTTKKELLVHTAHNILQQSTLIQDGKPMIYHLPLTPVYANKKDGLFKYDIGVPSDIPKPEKVLMVLGATGAGKSTLINGMVNFFLRVNWKDTFRFKIISDEGSNSQAQSQTKTITAYSFHFAHLPYVITIIDTPGFGDTGGIDRDKRIAGQIKQFFSGRDRGGIDQLNGIGFVTQSSLARLTPTQKYIFDAVLSIFGNDIVDNIFLLTTFADADVPSVLEATRVADIPYKEFFKFNNSALFASNVSTESAFNSFFWEMGRSSFEQFFDRFARATSRSLALTREVLNEREQLEALIPGLQEQVKIGLSQLDVIQQDERILKQHEADLEANKDFDFFIDVPKFRKFPESSFTTTCLTCTFTCHKSCVYSDDDDKKHCCAMNGTGYCTVCPQQCHWRSHRNLPYTIEYYTERTPQTGADLKKRYETAETGKKKVTAMVAQKEEVLGDLQRQVYSLINRVRHSIKRLSEIALRPNPLTEIEYIELLIESEKQEQKPNWKKRVQQYNKIREDAKLLKAMPQVPEGSASTKSWWKTFWS